MNRDIRGMRRPYEYAQGRVREFCSFAARVPRKGVWGKRCLLFDYRNLRDYPSGTAP